MNYFLIQKGKETPCYILLTQFRSTRNFDISPKWPSFQLFYPRYTFHPFHFSVVGVRRERMREITELSNSQNIKPFGFFNREIISLNYCNYLFLPQAFTYTSYFIQGGKPIFTKIPGKTSLNNGFLFR